MLPSQVDVNLLLKLGHSVDGMTDLDLSGHNWRCNEHKLWTNRLCASFNEKFRDAKTGGSVRDCPIVNL